VNELEPWETWSSVPLVTAISIRVSLSYFPIVFFSPLLLEVRNPFQSFFWQLSLFGLWFLV
jgi:hypothetical protein